MKAISVLFALVLTMSPVVNVNAQTSNPTAHPTASAGVECDANCMVQRKLNRATQNRLGKLDREVKAHTESIAGLKAQQANQNDKIGTVSAKAAAATSASNQAVTTATSAETLAQDASKRAEETNQIIKFACGGIALLLFAVVGIVVWLKKNRRATNEKFAEIEGASDAMRIDVEGLLDEGVAIKAPQKRASGVTMFFSLPSNSQLRELWQNSNGSPIRFSCRMFAVKGDPNSPVFEADGFTATYPIGRKYPEIRHERTNAPMQLRDLKDFIQENFTPQSAGDSRDEPTLLLNKRAHVA